MSSTFPGLNNYVVPVRGSTVTAYLGEWVEEGVWVYALYDERDELLGTSRIDFEGLPVTPDQVARIAFLLEVDYP